MSSHEITIIEGICSGRSRPRTGRTSFKLLATGLCGYVYMCVCIYVMFICTELIRETGIPPGLNIGM